MSIATDPWVSQAPVSRTNPLPVLPLSSSGSTVADNAHSIVHQGRMFVIDSIISGVSPDVLNDANLDLVITPSADNYPHAQVSYRLGGTGRVEVYLLAEGSVMGGTSVPAINKKWDSAALFGGSAVVNPTINFTGSSLKESCIILGSTGIGQSRSGSSGDFADEIIMLPNRPVLFRLKNESGATVRACFCIDIYNAVKINT